MLKSSNRIGLIPLFAAILVFGCNKEKTTRLSPEAKVEQAAKSSSIDSVAEQVDAEKAMFSIPIEGYRASKLGESIHSGSLENFKTLLQSGSTIEQCLADATYIYDAIYASIAFHKIEFVEYILANKLFSDINKAYSEEAETLLTLACGISDKDTSLTISGLLIEKGANVNGAGNLGGEETKTPLFVAIKQNNLELVKLLLEKGVNKEITNASGASPIAFSEEIGFSAIAEILK